ncbi:carbonic anhydrase [bacterium]|nr:carbonic anhydrase [bacterium]NBX72546.1 carbonic anhydrase [bacterium]
MFLSRLLFLGFASCVVAADPGFKSFFNEIAQDNKAFVEKHQPDYFNGMANSQKPIATVVLCSDSRMQDEAFDDDTINKLFVIRNIGNQLETAQGSIDYGVTVLKTPILMIVGHSACGAVDARLHIDHLKDLSPAITKEVKSIVIDSSKTLPHAVVDNVNYQVKQACERYADYIKDNKLIVVGAIYDFKNDYGHGLGKFFVINMNGQANLDKKTNKNLIVEDLL